MKELTEKERIELVEAACEAEEIFDLDELERFAARKGVSEDE